MAELSPAAQAVLSAMRRSYDHEPTRCAMAADILWALSQYLPIQELTREVPDEFEQGMAQGQHLSKAWLEMVSEELRAAELAAFAGSTPAAAARSGVIGNGFND